MILAYIRADVSTVATGHTVICLVKHRPEQKVIPCATSFCNLSGNSCCIVHKLVVTKRGGVHTQHLGGRSMTEKGMLRETKFGTDLYHVIFVISIGTPFRTWPSQVRLCSNSNFARVPYIYIWTRAVFYTFFPFFFFYSMLPLCAPLIFRDGHLPRKSLRSEALSTTWLASRPH